MNKKRRDEIKQVMQSLLNADWRLEQIIYEEQEYIHNMPEYAQIGIKGQSAQEEVDYLQVIRDQIKNKFLELEEFI